MNRFHLTDTWRDKYPNDRVYTWSNESGSRPSRTGYWFISDSMNKDNITIEMYAMSLTDHKTILIKINISTEPATNSGYWKLSSSLVNNNLNLDGSKRLDLYILDKGY